MDMKDTAKVKYFMTNQRLAGFIIKNLNKSLKDIGFSPSFIKDLLMALPDIDINRFQLKYGEELKRVYTLGFFQKIVPDYFQKHVFPEMENQGVILDIGCGTGILAERLSKINGVKKVIGVDINPYPEWNDFKSDKVEFKVVKEENFEKFFNSVKINQIVLTWTLHHMEYNEQLRYLKMLHHSINPKTKIIILEDAFSETLTPTYGFDKYKEFMKLSSNDRKKVMSVYDWVANRILAQRKKVAIPFCYRTLEGWLQLCENIGFVTINKKFIGFPDKRDINTPQSLFVIKLPENLLKVR